MFFCRTIFLILPLSLTMSLSWCPRAWADFDPTEIERVYKAKNYAEVEHIARVRMAIDPYDVRARYFLAGALLHQKRAQEALTQYEACIKLGGETPLAKMSRQAIVSIKQNPKAFASPAKVVPKLVIPAAAVEDPDIVERKAMVQKELEEALNVHRRAKVEQMNKIANDEQDAIEAANIARPERDILIRAALDDAQEKRAKLERIYADIEKRTTQAYQERINALTKRKK